MDEKLNLLESTRIKNQKIHVGKFVQKDILFEWTVKNWINDLANNKPKDSSNVTISEKAKLSIELKKRLLYWKLHVHKL